MSKRRLKILLGLLGFLAVCHLAASTILPYFASTYRPSFKQKPPLWLSKEKFYKFVEGESLALPGGKALTLHKELIESLSMDRGGDGPESEAAEVSFVVRAGEQQYDVQGTISFHNSDGHRYPIVNMGVGWAALKK